MKLIGVVGCGIMGKGIVQLLLLNGYEVILLGTSLDKTMAATSEIRRKIDAMLSRGKISPDVAEKALGNLKTALNICGLEKCDLVIESITEDKQKKYDLMEQLSTVLRDDCIIASNTSSLKILGIAHHYKKPENVVGLHFFNPAPLMKLVEICSSKVTSKIAFSEIYFLAQSLGKEPIAVEDNAGFIVNRILIPMINEAYRCYENGTATKEDIDKAMKLGCNFPMGPFKLSELIGKNVCTSILENIYDNENESSLIPCKALRD